MKHTIEKWPAIFGLVIIAACNPSIQTPVKITQQSDFPAPPVATVKPSEFTEFGNKRIDNYFWLKDKSLADLDNLPDPDLLAGEIIENLEAGLASFQEILGVLNRG